MTLDYLQNQVTLQKHADEHELVNSFVLKPALNFDQRKSALRFARELVNEARDDKAGQKALDSFLLEFGLSNKEGVALMCLAESLLRVPDATSADRLIAEKVQSGDWTSHLGNSNSLFVNSSTWGLRLTGKVIRLDSSICEKPGSWVSRLTARLGEPLVRAAFVQAMKLMGEHYVLGRDIKEGLHLGGRDALTNTCYSFDMLGEAARTEADAQGYFDAYFQAINNIGKADGPNDIYKANGISVKLSALYPRYEFSQRQSVMSELLPRIKRLCEEARRYNIGLSIDAEEAGRLELSLEIFDALARDSSLKDWQGLGFVLQAYQKCAPVVAEWLIQLAKTTERRLMVRLVKGAYWDYEIKHAQEKGLKDYPVFTRKSHTDACYLCCAKQFFDAPGQIYPQFATHNAYTSAAVLELAKQDGQFREFEFQRLHGMGDLLYKHLRRNSETASILLRIYAPIGKHQDLLPYLVRRLLENGANSSFVHRFLDKDTPADELIVDIYDQASRNTPYRHSQIPLPADIYIASDEQRKNASGIDLDSALEIGAVLESVKAQKAKQLSAAPIVHTAKLTGDTNPIYSPTNLSSPIGTVVNITDDAIEQAIESAHRAAPVWQDLGAPERASRLQQMAELLEAHRLELIGLIVIEAGRTIPDAESEVREAIDFCRYYALQAERILTKNIGLQGCGVFFCISPWNFPLAIFVGQVAAALAAGNAVIAKPAAQTPSIAMRAVELFHQAGIPADTLHLLIGSGSKIGNQLLPDLRLSGVCFTGSTETAQTVNRQLADRSGEVVPLIAETGGQNCLIADSTALPEQLVDDIISSAFLSAGQRCSALRVLFIQDEIADKTLGMLKGAMQCLRIGDPSELFNDIGPVIDRNAREELSAHAIKMEKICKNSFVLPLDSQLDQGSFFAPRFYEIDSLSQLQQEIFGPILHIVRYQSDQLDGVIEQINNTGYGLTLGVHSRIEAFANHVIRQTNVGNNYINRNMVGAVVGVNPFGGMGLSGTGPKAGGPSYLYRFCRISKHETPATTALPFKSLTGPLADGNMAYAKSRHAFVRMQNTSPATRLRMLTQLLLTRDSPQSSQRISTLQKIAQELETPTILPGPTGEENLLLLKGRGLIISIATADSSESLQDLIALPLLTGCSVVVFGSDSAATKVKNMAAYLENLGLAPGAVQALPASSLKAYLIANQAKGVLVDGVGYELKEIKQILAKNEGEIINLVEFSAGGDELDSQAIYSILVNILVEKTRTENLVARGGNTKLFNIGQA